jgi:DNA-binding NtrC family response regulator
MTRSIARRRAAKTPAIVVVGALPTITDFLYGKLYQKDYALVTALLPSEVLRLLTRRSVPLVVCDDSAPSMRSLALMGEIKRLSPQTHVALVVPSGSPEQERRAREAEADFYVPSAFALKRLHTLLDDVLSKAAEH